MEASEAFRALADEGTQHARRPCWVTVDVTGEVDLSTAPDVLATLLDASTSGARGIVVDVSAVTFLGAAGVAVLVEARNHERQRGRDLVVRFPSRAVRRVLSICDLTDLLDCSATGRHRSSGGRRPATSKKGGSDDRFNDD